MWNRKWIPVLLCAVCIMPGTSLRLLARETDPEPIEVSTSESGGEIRHGSADAESADMDEQKHPVETDQKNDGEKDAEDSSAFETIEEEEGSLYTLQAGSNQVSTSVQNKWQTIEGKTFYYGADGTPSKGWITLADARYYLDPDTGELQKGLQTINSSRYYLDENSGRMKTGMLDVPEYGRCFFDTSGIMQTGWIKHNNIWYYFLPDTGVMKTGSFAVDGAWYYTDPQTGAMRTGQIEEDGNLYYHYSDGARSNGWARIDGNWFYHHPQTGIRQYGYLNIDGKEYYLDPSNQGKMQTGWQQTSGNWYLYGPDGDQKFGFYDHYGTEYYFNPSDGTMKTGTFTIGQVTYTTDDSGAVKKAVFSDIPYYMQTDGRWSSTTINGFSIGSTGCAPTVMTMVINHLTDHTVNPLTLARQLGSEGLLNDLDGLGCGDRGIQWIASQYGLKYECIRSLDQLKAALRSGKMIAGAMDEGIFTSPGTSHEILIYGWNNGFTSVLDPYFISHNGMYSAATIWDQRSFDPSNCRYGGPLIAFSPVED